MVDSHIYLVLILTACFCMNYKTLPLPKSFYFVESRPCQWYLKIIYQKANQIFSKFVFIFPIFSVHKFHGILENKFFIVITKIMLCSTMKLTKNISL